MEEQNLIEQINFAIKLFLNIILFAFIGFVIGYVFNFDAILSYKVIVFAALIGAFKSIVKVIERF